MGSVVGTGVAVGLAVGSGVAVGLVVGAGVGSGFVVGFGVTVGSGSVFSVPATMMKLTLHGRGSVGVGGDLHRQGAVFIGVQAGEGQVSPLPVQLVL